MKQEVQPAGPSDSGAVETTPAAIATDKQSESDITALGAQRSLAATGTKCGNSSTTPPEEEQVK